MAAPGRVVEATDGAYIVVGPSSIAVSRGEVEVFGVSVGPGERLVIPIGRRVAVRVRGSISVAGGEVLEASREAFNALEDAARRLAELEGRVVLVGPTDSGKSTLAAWASSISGSYLLTVDVGQNEYYAPGFETLVKPPSSLPLIPGSSAEIRGNCFVGSFTPSGSIDRYLSCASMLAHKAPLASRLFVDSDGWVSGPGALEAKLALLEAVGADHVVFIGDAGGLAQRLPSLLPSARVARLPRPPGLGSKSREERRLHRERLVALRLVGGRDVPVNASKVPVAGSPVFSCTEPSGGALELGQAPDLIYIEKCGDRTTAVFRRRPRGPLPRGVRVLVDGWERGLIAGIVDPLGGHHLALVTRVNYRSRVITVKTQYSGDLKGLILGKAKVNLSLGA